MSAPNPIPITDDGQGYWTTGGVFVSALTVTPIPAQQLAAGITIGQPFELGKHRTLSLLAQVTAKSGTSPTLDLTVLTSNDGATDWQSVGTFLQKTDVGLTMGAVAATGTTPPTITLTGTPTVPVHLQIQCTDISGGAARGQWLGRYSIDGGVTWTSFTSAATVTVNDANGNSIGLTINIATGNAATDNVWKAEPAGYERKRFSGLGRFGMVVANVGGSSTPTMTASVSGEAV